VLKEQKPPSDKGAVEGLMHLYGSSCGIMNKVKIIVYVLVLLSPICLCSCATVGIEKAQYTVLEKDGKFEIRQYQPQVVAETVVEADFADAGNIAFRRLFDYISGNNRSKESIAMTAPVNQQTGSGQKIAMTAPVNQQKSEGNYVVSFLMPSKYTSRTLPEPLDPNVRIREMPARKMAAIRYSGSWSQKRYDDPPFQLWFLRRNEVLFPVE
jgi:hypothetical protein